MPQPRYTRSVDRGRATSSAVWTTPCSHSPTRRPGSTRRGTVRHVQRQRDPEDHRARRRSATAPRSHQRGAVGPGGAGRARPAADRTARSVDALAARARHRDVRRTSGPRPTRTSPAASPATSRLPSLPRTCGRSCRTDRELRQVPEGGWSEEHHRQRGTATRAREHRSQRCREGDPAFRLGARIRHRFSGRRGGAGARDRARYGQATRRRVRWSRRAAFARGIRHERLRRAACCGTAWSRRTWRVRGCPASVGRRRACGRQRASAEGGARMFGRAGPTCPSGREAPRQRG